MSAFQSDIVLGQEYEDTQSPAKGIATAIYFFQFGCERVSLETYDESSKEMRTLTVDAPRLRHVETGKVATTTRTGGPGNGVEPRAMAPVR